MLKKLFKYIFLAKGWKIKGSLPPDIKKCVMIGAPHTSNIDGIFTIASFAIMKIPYRFTIKKEWMRFPVGLFIKPLGGIGIDRGAGKKKKSMVDAMAELFDSHKELVIVVTPEGTRKRVTQWKTGFYRVAEKAKVPIVLAYLDYKNKIAGIGEVIYPSGDIAKDFKKIADFYRDITPKFPENFAVPENQ
jgi:1-acyl-sn-glycerol-3-phosphate acyltransferase